MATTDIETLQVALKADLAQFERSMLRMTAVTEARTRSVENRVSKMTGTIRSQSAAAGASMEVMAGQTGNVAAQFQDIGVQLAGGQSPFLIALQQGTQLSSVLAQTGNPIKALGAAFLSLANPISIATIATIALGGAAVQWLTRTEDSIEGADAAVKSHAEQIKEVVAGYEAAVEAVEKYRQEADRLPQGETQLELRNRQAEAERKLAAALLEVQQQYLATNISEQTRMSLMLEGGEAALRQRDALLEIQAAAQRANPDLNAIALSLKEFISANPESALLNIAQAMLENVEAARGFKRDLGDIKVAIENVPSEVLVRFNVQLEGFAEAQKQLRDLMPDFRDQFTRLRDEAQSAYTKQLSSATDGILREQAQRDFAGVMAGIDEAQRRFDAAQASRDGARGGGAVSQIEQERQAVSSLIEQLQYEQAILGLTEQQKAVMNALRQAGAAATGEEQQAIADLVNATYAEQQAIQATAQAMQDFNNTAQQGLQTFLRDIMAGKDATEALGNALSNIGSQLLNAGLGAISGGMFTIPMGNKNDERLSGHCVPGQGGAAGGRRLLPAQRPPDSAGGQGGGFTKPANGDHWPGQAHRLRAA